MSRLANLQRQDRIFREDARRAGFTVGIVVGFTAGIIFACVWIIAWAMIFKG